MNPTPHSDTSTPVVWIAATSRSGELAVPALDVPSSLAATSAHLRRAHLERLTRERKVPPDMDTVAAAVDRDLALFESGRAVSGSAPTVTEAFLTYFNLARLTPRAALRRWRQGFPRAAGVCALKDPLRAVVRALEMPTMPEGPEPIE